MTQNSGSEVEKNNKIHLKLIPKNFEDLSFMRFAQEVLHVTDKFIKKISTYYVRIRSILIAPSLQNPHPI